MSEVKLTSVFSKNIEAYNGKAPLIINQGGTSSSKTYSVLQLLYFIAKYSKTKLIISVVSYALPHLKLGAIRDFDNILISFGIIPDEIKNKTELYYKVGNSVIEFFSADNLSKVHGPRRDILFLNECNHLKYDIYTHLQIRTKKCIFLDYNPVREFWVHTEVIPHEKHVFIKSTFQDNQYLDEEIRKRILAKQHNHNWWRVYGMGETGQLEGIIFDNWKFGQFDNTLPFVFGLDFGVRDPDALVKIAVNKKQSIIYCQELLYQNSLSTEQLAELIKTRVPLNGLIIADSASLRTIKDLSKLRFNIKPVYKNKIVEDIKMIKDYQLVVSEDSYNLSRELNNYVWMDKIAEVPIDEDNHLIDAMRYAFTTYIRKKVIG